VRRNEQIVYRYTYENGQNVDLPAYQVLHIRGLTLDGLAGLSPVRQLMREAVGLGLAAQEYGARFYQNGARPGGVLEHPGALSEKARANVLASWTGAHQGVGNAHKLRILEEGMKYHAITIPPNEAQFLETRKFQVSEIARAFGVPPHMIGDLDKATFSNIEHQAIEFAQYSLQPWMTQMEQAINAACLWGEDERDLFVEHVSEALVKTDILTRYKAHQLAILTGFETPNEARVMENRNPLPGGDVLLQPLNMAPMGSNAKPDAEGAEKG
jgi:HK97 family phage portal protein